MNTPAAAAPIDAGAVYRRLLGYARPHLGMFLIGVVGMALFAATGPGFAWLVQNFVDLGFVKKDPTVLWLVPLGAPLLFLLRGVGDYVGVYFPGYVSRQIIKAMRRDLFRQYLRFPAKYYDRESSGTMLSRLTFNIEQVAEATTNSTGALIRDSLTIILQIGWLFALNWKLALFVVILAPPLSFIIRQVTKSFRRYSARIQNSMGDVTRVTKEALDGHRVIKVFNAQEQEGRDFEQVNEGNRRSNMKLIAAKATSNPVVQFIASIGLGGVLWMALVQVNDHDMTVGEFWSFLTALLLTTAPMRTLVTALGPLQQGLAAGHSVFEVLDEPTEDFKTGRKVGRLKGGVEFRDVSFEYSSEKGGVLHDVNLTVAAGRNIAIVGRSGSGKSTLVGLVARFYDPTSGSVRVDGMDVRECNLRELRDN